MWRLAQRINSTPLGLSIRSGHRRAFSGFSKWEESMTWYPTRAEMEKAPEYTDECVIVAKSYLTDKIKKSTGEYQQVKKYSIFANYQDYYKKISKTDVNAFHEVLPKQKPRCLYFDIDGKPVFKKLHDQIVGAMTHLVYWFFFRDRADVSHEDIQPVVMTTDSPNKYSCHMIFPQIQFKDQVEQNEYLATFFKCMSSISDDFSFLPRLVDKQPYGVFQCFRGPRACKVDSMSEDAKLIEDSTLIPKEYFKGDKLTGFIGYVNPKYRILLEPLTDIVEQSDFKKAHYTDYIERTGSGDREFNEDVSRVSMLGLFVDEFVKDEPTQLLEVPVGDAADEFGIYLQTMHPDRAHHYLTWKYVSSVAFSVIDDRKDQPDFEEYKEKVMSSFLNWASAYPYYDEGECVRMVEMWRRYHRRSMGFVYDLVKFDNPGIEIRSAQLSSENVVSVVPDWDLPDLPPDVWEQARGEAEAESSGEQIKM
eukprot:gene1132-668_t